MESGGGAERRDTGEEELEGEERGREGREGKEDFGGGEDGIKVRVRVLEVEKWV